MFVGQNLWVNSSITNARVTRIELIYMDGTTETLCGNDIEQNNLSTASERDKNPKEWLGVALIWGALFLLVFLIVKLL